MKEHEPVELPFSTCFLSFMHNMSQKMELSPCPSTRTKIDTWLHIARRTGLTVFFNKLTKI